MLWKDPYTHPSFLMFSTSDPVMTCPRSHLWKQVDFFQKKITNLNMELVNFLMLLDPPSAPAYILESGSGSNAFLYQLCASECAYIIKPFCQTLCNSSPPMLYMTKTQGLDYHRTMVFSHDFGSAEVISIGENCSCNSF